MALWRPMKRIQPLLVQHQTGYDSHRLTWGGLDVPQIIAGSTPTYLYATDVHDGRRVSPGMREC
jgi:hypothetical protein